MDYVSAKNPHSTTLGQSEEMARSKNKHASPSVLRIIGGKWRSRKLAFNPQPGLRPTADRVRETLFNWLAPAIQDARCVDLFSGSGALGLEALSRGAASCDFVDTSRTTLKQIEQHLKTLDAVSYGNCHLQSAERFIASSPGSFDIIFIDPPFDLNLVDPVCQQLEQSNLLAKEAWLYVETARANATPQVPESWQLHRDKNAGDVAYRLYHCETP